MQTTYGQGTKGQYDETSGLSWGPRIEGQTYTRWDGKEVAMQRYDNLNNYFGTGTEIQENVTLSQQYGKTSIYASVTNMNNKSMTPGAKLNRTNMMLRGVTNFGKNNAWTFDAKVQYIRNKANNRPVSGNNSNNSALGMYTFPTTLDIRDFENCVDENNQMTWWNKDGNNPYWMSKYNLSDDNRDRFLMNASLKYKVLSWLTAEVKAGTDMYTLETTNRTYSGNSHLVTKYGQCIRFNEKDVRSTGRVSMGVRGMNLSDNDEIIGMQMSSQGKDMLIVSEKGMGKRTSMEEFTKQNRGGKGVKCYKITEKTGNVVGMKAVDEESEIMIINTEGIVIRMKCSDISQYGRITSGVKLINLPEKERVASVAKVRTASAEIDGEEVEIKEEDDSPENTSEIIVDNSEDNVSDDVENK